MLSVGIIGLGTIGSVVAKALDDGIAGMKLVAVASGRRERAIANLSNLSSSVDVMTIDEVSERCEDRKSTRQNSSHESSRMPSSA